MTPTSGDAGPILRAAPFDAVGDGVVTRLLTDRQRRVLASLSTRVVFAPRRIVYRAEGTATALYICNSGALKSYRELPSGKRRVASFLFGGDLFGLAQNGRYMNTAQALTRTVCHRIPLDAIKAVLRQDAELEFQFLCKVVHEIRHLQLRIVMMGRRSAAGRVAMFVWMLERKLGGPKRDRLPVPMSRTDIADYLGLSPESVSRAARQLIDSGIIAFESRRRVRIVNRKALERLATDV